MILNAFVSALDIFVNTYSFSTAGRSLRLASSIVPKEPRVPVLWAAKWAWRREEPMVRSFCASHYSHPCYARCHITRMSARARRSAGRLCKPLIVGVARRCAATGDAVKWDDVQEFARLSGQKVADLECKISFLMHCCAR